MRGFELIQMRHWINRSQNDLSLQLAALSVVLIAVFITPQLQASDETPHAPEVETPESEAEHDLEAMGVDARLARQNIQRIESQLRDLEGRVDAYDIGISELNLELGDQYLSIGNYEEALKVFRRSLHVSRINHGLNSELQLPILEKMHSTQTDSGQIENAGQTLERILLVYLENYGPYEPALSDIYERIGVWHLGAYYFGLDRQGLSHLLAANGALSQAFSIDSAQGGYGYDYDLYNFLAMTNYGMASYVNEGDPVTEQQLASMATQGVGNLISGSYRRGRSLLESGVKVAFETGDTENLVRATLLYADWHQLFNKRHTARELYINAYSAAQQLPENNPVRRSFNQPHQLPNFNYGILGQAPDEDDTVPVTIEFDVSSWGTSGTIQVLNEEDIAETRKSVRRAAIRSIRTATYRPAIHKGQPIDFKGVRQTVVVKL